MQHWAGTRPGVLCKQLAAVMGHLAPCFGVKDAIGLCSCCAGRMRCLSTQNAKTAAKVPRLCDCAELCCCSEASAPLARLRQRWGCAVSLVLHVIGSVQRPLDSVPPGLWCGWKAHVSPAVACGKLCWAANGVQWPGSRTGCKGLNVTLGQVILLGIDQTLSTNYSYSA